MHISNVLFRVVDTETTGVDPEHDRIVEMGFVDLVPAQVNDEHALRFVRHDSAFSWLADPGIEIPPEAKAVHHITNGMVAGCPPPERTVSDLTMSDGGALGVEDIVFVAHNADFDRSMLEAAGFPKGETWLCTYRLALHLWPDAPSFKNEVLRYWRGYDTLPWVGIAHRAEHDVQVTALLLAEMLEALGKIGVSTVEELIAFAQKPAILRGKMKFGKHRDRTWEEVARQDPGYLEWMLRQPPGSWDVDQIATIKHHLGAHR